jgi:hypothetical protein
LFPNQSTWWSKKIKLIYKEKPFLTDKIESLKLNYAKIILILISQFDRFKNNSTMNTKSSRRTLKENELSARLFVYFGLKLNLIEVVLT